MNENLNNERLMKKRWVILFAACMINLCIGSLYAWSVFAGPMAQYLSTTTGKAITTADLSIVFSIANSTGFITMIGGGFLNQKIGPKWVIFIGGVLFGLGFVISGFAQNIGVLLMGFGVVSGLAMGLAYGCTISNSVKFFPDKKGLVGGIATASYGISSVLIPPFANGLIEKYAVSKSFIILGIVTMVLVGVFSQPIEKCPDDFMVAGMQEQKSDPGVVVKDYTWKEMLKMPVFYVMIIMLFFGAVLGMMIISQASVIAQNSFQMKAKYAAIIVSVLALFNTFGRIAAGFISDRIGCINTLFSTFVISILAFVLMLMGKNVLVFSVAICLVGICFGAFMGVYPGFTTQEFGRKNSGVNYGIMFIGFNLAGLIGPIIIGNIYKMTNGYKTAFLAGIVFAVLGIVLSFVYRSIKKRA